MARFDEESFEKLVSREQTRRELAMMEEIEEQLLGAFGCHKAEEEIKQYLISARQAGATWEEFCDEYLSQFGTCRCRTDTCSWTAEAILERLEENDLLDLFQEYLLF